MSYDRPFLATDSRVTFQYLRHLITSSISFGLVVRQRGVGEEAGVLAARGGELDACAAWKRQGDNWGSCETQRSGVAQNCGASLRVVFAGFELADGRAGQDQEIARLE